MPQCDTTTATTLYVGDATPADRIAVNSDGDLFLTNIAHLGQGHRLPGEARSQIVASLRIATYANPSVGPLRWQ